ncbi:DUF3857 and transglutaminase domain-containing protein [Paracraurococcus lichenis]|uniref:DUF3857 and transglutaminase domain-containing protein n=1 Tax=Paracraurococcus lichenis TaxID=3064888 RepID=A0ABT9E8V5_9PROT|nr:DUF3857 and transglutaminase domain-containing protein [Paracraurococcus sp. LOR1-02]MDO9712418.1 DUF3857 and transglutaminase domain-containing protein [Paracraurococcus sp. LOR1-02]
MRHRIGLGVALLCAALAGQTRAAEPAASIRLFRSDILVEADGRAVQTTRTEIAAGNDAAAQREAQQAMTYSEGVERIDLVEGYTLKPDGRRLPVPPASVRRQMAPGQANLPQYANRVQVIAILPEVAGGDVLVTTWKRTIVRPVFPGRFALTTLFARTATWEDAEVTIRLPRGMPLVTEEFGPAHAVAAEGGMQVHRWRWRAPAVATDIAVLAPLDRLPRIFASSFPDWPTFSREYAALVARKVRVTPRIQELADSLAAGSADRREEARRLFDWVARNIRWVAIYVGDGNFVPNDAELVLSRGHGDCKDQVVLLMALLQARGIAAEPVLVNLGPTYRLSGPPTLTAFNHVIAWLPDWDLYGDSTAAGTPLGILAGGLYGKPILHVTAAGAAPRRMPAVPPGFSTSRLVTRMALDGEGRIAGESLTEATGAYVPWLRRMAAAAQAQGGERAAAEQLRAIGQIGTGLVVPAPLGATGPGYSVSGRFSLEARPGLLEGDGFQVPSGMRLLPRAGDGLLGPALLRGLPATEPTPCQAGEQAEDLELTLPPGFRLARLPRDRSLKGEAWSFEARWSLEGGTLRVARRMASRVEQPLCEGPLRTEAAKLLEEVRRDIDTRIELERVD